MGCDIHLHIEVKMEGKWRHYSAPDVNREYRLFALMANVRNYEDLEPVSEPKGLPDNMTYLTRKDYESWKKDAHDESYLTVEEIIELKKEWKYLRHTKGLHQWLEPIFHTYILGNGLTGWYEYPEDNEYNIEDIRLVFWFDN